MKKINRDQLIVTMVLIATIVMAVISYLVVMNVAQLWDMYLQYLAQGQNVGLNLLFSAVGQNIGLQLFIPILMGYGCFVLTNYVVPTNQNQRLYAFWFGVLSLGLGSLMIIFQTPLASIFTVVIFIVMGLTTMILGLEKPSKTGRQEKNCSQNYRYNQKTLKKHRRPRYLA